ncbi:ABC transporter substrate-binding protein [Lysinibacillus sp. MHQ-1]|nr:ABC transporter substrate-binding protein [Lysinibacillus sp. MHQ-1]
MYLSLVIKFKKILDDGTGFAEISTELLPEYAGDRIFILTPVDDEAKQSTKEMMDSPIWKSLPAVKNGHVYMIDIQKSDSDASTREWLLTELPTMLKKIDLKRHFIFVEMSLYFLYNKVN